MRGIPASGVFIFFALVFLIEVLAFFSIHELLDRPKIKRQVSIVYWGLTAVLTGILAFAFLNPEKIRQTTDYQFFYFVISVSFLNLVPKILLSASLLIALIFRLFRARFHARVLLTSATILSLGLMLNIGYGIAFGRKSLRVVEQEVYLKNLPKSLDKMVLVQISDFHLGSFEDASFLKRATSKINSFDPELIFFTGDMVNNYYEEMLGFEEVLAEMTASHGKFAILGNHDYGDYSNWKDAALKASNHEALLKKIEAAGFRLLLNESADTLINNTTIEVIGVENWGHPPFPQYADLDKAIKQTADDSFKILLSHDPAHWAEQVIGKTPVSLTLSGHTHAAQSGVQFAGIEFSPMYFVQKYWGGLYREGDQYLYVNRGLGCVGLMGRIEMNPEITVLTLRSK